MSESYQLDSSEIAYRKKKRFVLPGLSRLSPGVIDAQKKFFSPMLSVGQQPTKVHSNSSLLVQEGVSFCLEGIILSQSRMPSDAAICEYILSMGLSVSLSIYIAFRAGRRLRNLTTENLEERLSDFTFDSLKELIADKLQTLLESEGIPLPAGISILDVAAHIHLDHEDTVFLQGIYHSLVVQNIQSPHFQKGVAYIIQAMG